MADESAPRARVWLVDGYNALQVALLAGGDRARFWTREARQLLLSRARGFEDEGAEVWVVFDGPHAATDPGSEEGEVRVVFAPSADEWLLRRVRDAAPGEVALVTADRRLAARARARGAEVVAPRAFLERCRVGGYGLDS
jgi:predicted RNA-binding protein with PIN domain